MPSPAKRAPIKRRQRAHDVLPAGYAWRDGRPRWIPSPTRRKQGWKAIDLKDAWGKWLAKGPAICRAEEIANAVAGWSKGEPVPSAFVAIAPKGADLKGAVTVDANPRAIGVLFDAYLASPKFGGLAPKTQGDYRSKIGRLLEVVACPTPPTNKAGEVDKAKLAAKVEKLRQLDIDLFLPPQFGQAGESVLEEAYDRLLDQAGHSMAFGTLAATSAWFGWCVKKRRVWPSNPALLIERSSPDGRIRVAEWEELVALITTADAMGLHSIADAIVLAVDLSWSQQDLLALTWSQVSPSGHVKHRRIKTGVAGNPPLLALGRDRLEKVRARQQGGTIRPAVRADQSPVLLREGTFQRWDEFDFRRNYSEVRATAALTCPAVADLQFRDLRDTAITYGIEAGLNLHQICSRSLHTPARAQAVHDKHYGAIRQEVADEAGVKLDAHMLKKGWVL